MRSINVDWPHFIQNFICAWCRSNKVIDKLIYCFLCVDTLDVVLNSSPMLRLTWPSLLLVLPGKGWYTLSPSGFLSNCAIGLMVESSTYLCPFYMFDLGENTNRENFGNEEKRVTVIGWGIRSCLKHICQIAWAALLLEERQCGLIRCIVVKTSRWNE